jgi:hypothetical protein
MFPFSALQPMRLLTMDCCRSVCIENHKNPAKISKDAYGSSTLSHPIPISLCQDDLIARELHQNVSQGFAAVRAAWTEERLDPAEVLAVLRQLVMSVRRLRSDVSDECQRELLENRTNELERWMALLASEAEKAPMYLPDDWQLLLA